MKSPRRLQSVSWPAAALLLLTAIATAVTGVEPVRATSSTVVISEFRVRGPNGGSDEFVELYNLSASPVAIGGWKINGSNNAGTISTRVTIGASVVLNPGCHFLATNSSANGGPYSGAVPGDQTYATGITDDGGIALLTSSDVIVDQVGLSAGSAYKEGTPLASLGSQNVNRGYERLPGGAAGSATDTDSNTADFRLLAPSDPQSLASSCVAAGTPTGAGSAMPSVAGPGDSVLLTVAVTPGTPPQSISSVTGDLQPIGGGAAESFFDDGTNGDAVAGDLTYSLRRTIAPGTPSGAKTLDVTIVDVGMRTGHATIDLTVAVPPAVVAIHDIQGPGDTSPFAGQIVTTEGVVTARRFNNGFFVQTRDNAIDADSRTSEGIFVFTSAAPPAAAAVGNFVRVTGTVSEFVPSADPTSPPLTEIGGPTVTLISDADPLPAAVVLTPDDLNASTPFNGLERFEGMRISVQTLTVVAPTGGTVIEANATATSNGVFFGVLPGVARPFREPGLDVLDPIPPMPPPHLPLFDHNSERLRVDSDGQVNAPRIDVATGATIAGLVGVLDYAFRAYTLLPDASPAPTVSGGVFLSFVRAAADDEFTIASANLERFFDTTNDAGSDVVLTPAAFAMRLNKVSLQMRKILRLPDIIGVEEVENLSTLQAIADKVNADASMFGQPSPAYVPYLEEGNDPGGIDVGFLVKSTRVTVLEVTQIGKDARFTDPRDGSSDVLNDRPPLLLRAEVHASGRDPVAVTVIVNHLRSLDGVNDPADPPGSTFVRAKRRAQAEFLASLVQTRQAGDPNERIVLVGDFNAFPFNDALVDVIGTVIGAPASADEVVLSSLDLVDPNLTQLSALAPVAQRYSFVFDGNAQLLDHVIVTPSTLPLFRAIQWGRVNADFPESLRGIATRPERLSDHDPVVAFFAFSPRGPQ